MTLSGCKGHLPIANLLKCAVMQQLTRSNWHSIAQSFCNSWACIMHSVMWQ